MIILKEAAAEEKKVDKSFEISIRYVNDILSIWGLTKSRDVIKDYAQDVFIKISTKLNLDFN